MSRLNINNLTNENEDGSPRISGISTFSSPHYFVPPSGTTAERPSDPGEGMIRFNTDSGHLEYYTGEFWDDVIVNETSPISARGLIRNGSNNTIQYVTISSTGNALDFGDTGSDRPIGSTSSRTRGIFATGYIAPAVNNTMEYVTISTLGNALDFGDTAHAGVRVGNFGVCSNGTRGIFAGGLSLGPTVFYDVIQDVTIASTGDAQDFGDLTLNRNAIGTVCSQTRGIFGGGYNPAARGTIDYITIASKGDAVSFGSLSQGRARPSGVSNNIRGVFGGGDPNGAFFNIIDYVTISTTGNAQDFGDLTGARRSTSSASSPTRGIFAGGTTPPAPGAPGLNIIDFITIPTKGDALDFGDLSAAQTGGSGLSNAHGGL